MDDNVMNRYTTPPTEPRHYVQYDQGDFLNTVNSGIFARVYCRETSEVRSFMKIKHSQTG